MIFVCVVDGMYGNFAGRDASRGMAKQSFDAGEFSSLSLPIQFRDGNLPTLLSLRDADAYRPTSRQTDRPDCGRNVRPFSSLIPFEVTSLCPFPKQ